MIVGVKCGLDITTKKMIRVLYTAVIEVAISVTSKAQALVLDVLRVSMIKSFE